MDRKQYAAFLSYAQPDFPLVQKLAELLNIVADLPYFFAPQDLPRGSDDWVKEIMSGISNSASFIPVITRNSFFRPWVLYECGAADMLKLPFCRVRTADVTNERIAASFPGRNRYTYSLFEKEQLFNIICKINENWTGTKVNDSVRIKKLLEHSDLSNQIHHLAGKRTVFIAGSLAKIPSPAGPPCLDNGVQIDPQELLTRATQDLCKALLTEGFTLSACPDVSSVGLNVAGTVEKWISEHNGDWRDVFKIGGQLEISEQLNEKQCGTLDSFLKQAFKESRKEYLADQEAIIFIGGNERTAREYEVAKEIPDLLICPIPMFGGTGYSIWEEKNNKWKFPCNPGERVWNESICKRIVEFVKAHEFN